MTRWSTSQSDTAGAGTRTCEATLATSTSPSTHPGLYHPSDAFRRLVNAARKRGHQPSAARLISGSRAVVRHAPRLRELVAASIAVGAASGILELLVHAIELRVLHKVNWNTLVISQHASWMVIVVATVLTPFLAVLFLAPALSWAAFRHRQGAAARAPGVDLGPVRSDPRRAVATGPSHGDPGAPSSGFRGGRAGAGAQFRRWLVRPTLSWQRGACWAGGIVLGVLPIYSLWQCHATVSMPDRDWSTAGAATPSVLWIVLDTLRADHTSVHGYARPPHPLSKNGRSWESRSTWQGPRRAGPCLRI